MLDKILASVLMGAIGAALIFLYMYVINRRFRLKLDFVEAILYQPSSREFKIGDIMFMWFFAILKIIGFLFIISAIFTPFRR